MSWWKRRKALASDRDQTPPIHTGNYEALVKIGERMNSSKHIPGLARVHNEHQKQSGTPQLLALPPKVFEKILRYTVVESTPICVAVDHPEDCDEGSRGILSVCHAVRDIARPMFYQENICEVQIFNFDVMAVLPWLKRATAFREGFVEVGGSKPAEQAKSPLSKEHDEDTRMGGIDGIALRKESASECVLVNLKHKTPDISSEVQKIFGKSYAQIPESNKDKSLTQHQIGMLKYFINAAHLTLTPEQPFLGDIYWNTKFEPHWDTLIIWLRAFHRGEVGRYVFDRTNPDSSTAVSGLFDLVEMEKEEGREWAMFQRRLEGLRHIMGATDADWLVEK